MRERLEQILKIVCVALAALLVVQLVRVAMHINPLAGARMPELPSLPADTNEVAHAEPGKPPKMGTNVTGTNALHKNASSTNAAGTNAAMMAAGTNTLKTNAAALMAAGTNEPGTNAAAMSAVATNGTATNELNVKTSTTNAPDTNEMARLKSQEESSNAEPAEAMASSETNHSETNVSTAVAPGTNGEMVKVAANTNISTSASNKMGGTNLAKVKKSHPKIPGPGFPPMMGGPGGGKPASLPPDIQARVNLVTESEILGPVMHPMPMALLGIAGNVAFLRSANGQTGLVKEGDELGDIKLLRIGVNRVLIEQGGEKKELMIFSGFGGESLLPKPTESSDETTKKH